MYQGKYNKKCNDLAGTAGTDPTIPYTTEKKRGRYKLYIVSMVVLILCGFIMLLFYRNENSINCKVVEKAIYDEYALLLNYDHKSSNPLIEQIYSGLEIEVHSVESAKEFYLANCTFSNHDMISAFSGIQDSQEENSYENFVTLLVEEIKNQERISFDTQVAFVALPDGSYQVQFSEDQLDMAMGGFLAYSKQILGEE